MDVKIEATWKEALKEEFDSEYFKNLKKFLVEEKSKYKIFPPGAKIFEAFNLCPLDKTKVVIIGQDPYHGVNQAHGLCFSVQNGIKPPPSLVNIFKEYNTDLNLPIPQSGELTTWAKQGVLMLNATLTVRAHQANSHSGKGWENFTDAAIKSVSDKRAHCVFILWGSYAQKKASLIDNSKHLIIKAPHPSPLSSYRGFFGSKPFSKSNDWLKAHNMEPINWRL
jgi:uracil-DNA glycosylase